MPRPADECPTVQLLHTLPGGEHHIDWMIAVDPAGRLPLITFRLAGRIDAMAIGDRAEATRIDDHRPHYLTHEGPVSGDRGVVTRVASGSVLWLERGGNRLRLEVRWSDTTADRPIQIRLDLQQGDRWLVAAVAETPQSGHNGS